MNNLVLPVLLFGLIYVAVILPQSRKRKHAAALQRAVEPGSRVMLTSGLYGTVVEMDDAAVVIEAAQGVHLRYAKAAVLRVIPDDIADIDDEDDTDHEDDGDGVDDGDHVDHGERGDGNDAGSGSVPRS